jgi:hypothetical protein
MTESSEATVILQSHIGWGACFEGCLGKEWRIAQEQHYKSIKFHYSGRLWITALITKLWQVAWDLWEHRNGIEHEHNSNQQIQEKAWDVKNIC